MSMVKLTLDDFITRASSVHADKYDYSRFLYDNTKTKGIIICPIHGNFLQTPNDHLAGHGCYRCGHDKVGKTKCSTSSKFIANSNKIHEYKYNYSHVKYVNAHKKVIIICPFHGKFFQSPHNHLHYKGCPKCCSSKGELKIQNWLRKSKIKYI